MNKKINIVPVKNYGHPGTFAYKWFYYKSTIEAVLRPHRLDFKKPRYGRDSNFFYHESTRNRWNRLCCVPENIEVPFTVYGYSGAVGMMRVLKDLGVNFRHLLHLKSEIEITKLMKPETSYTIDYIFEDVLKIKADKAALIGTMRVTKDGEIYMQSRDHFVIKEVPAADLAELREDESGQFRGITRIPAGELQNASSEELYIAENFARDYGHASGDRNIVHTTPLSAKIFGFRKPFIQGLCTANMIMSRLTMAGINLGYFSIVFCRPVYLKSRTILSYNSDQYRLEDEKGRVLSFGNIRLREE